MNTICHINGTQGAEAAIERLSGAEYAASCASADYIRDGLQPLLDAREEAFKRKGADSPEWAAACSAVGQHLTDRGTDPVGRGLLAAYHSARDMVARHALSYLTGQVLGDILAIHRAGGGRLDADMAAIVTNIGHIDHEGWRMVTVSPHGAWNRRCDTLLFHGGLAVVRVTHDGGVAAVTSEAARRLAGVATRRCRRRERRGSALLKLAAPTLPHP